MINNNIDSSQYLSPYHGFPSNKIEVELTVICRIIGMAKFFVFKKDIPKTVPINNA